MSNVIQSSRESRAVRASILEHFGVCDLDPSGEFYGPRYSNGQRGMRYGYLVRESDTIRGYDTISVVDCTNDGPDVVVDSIRV